jgi:hypothetical protein
MRRLGLVLFGLLPASLAAQEVAWEGGLSVATGRYMFTERTTGWSLNTGFAFSAGPLSFRVSLPVLLQNSTLVTSSGSTWIPSGGSHAGTVADSGAARQGRQDGGAIQLPATTIETYEAAIGDPTGQVSWRVLSAAHSVTLRAAVKAPLADTGTFGTGAWDFGFGASLTQIVARRLFLGADISWWRLGDLPELNFRDPFLASLSAGAFFAPGWGTLLTLSGGTPVLDGYDAPLTLGAAVSRLTGGTIVGLNGAVGLTETAPDLILGFSWRVQL